MRSNAVILFIIGMLLTIRSIFGDNSYKRATVYASCRNHRQFMIVTLGEAFMEGILCAILIMTLILAFFYIWEIV